jgi:multidrug efflux system outer membrane protein
MNKSWFNRSVLLVATGLSACSLAPRYKVPDAPTPVAYKEAMGADPSGTWQTAMPAEEANRGEWWKVFQDTALDALEQQAADANQDLAAAMARVKEARAQEHVEDAALYPSLNAGFGPTRQQNAAGSLGYPAVNGRPQAQTVWRAQGTVSYEVDLFGRVASTVHAAHADTQQSEALYRSVMLTLQGDVAERYFSVRELDAELEVYHRTVELRADRVKFVQNRFDAGDVTDLELSQAKAELASARCDAMTVERQRAIAEHALAVLLGKAPADFAMAPHPLEPVVLNIPPGLPSSLLERRPDIAAAERAMAAENARIGVAKAAYFPSLVLTGTGGYESAKFSDLFKWSARSFLLGPLVGTSLSLPIFDGGVKKGNLANARARYEEGVANYRQQVLVAFRDVEDNLSNLRILAEQTKVQADEVSASARAAQLSRVQYEDGSVAYLLVIDAERVALSARLNAVRLQGTRASSTVNLIRALGGGWGDPAAQPPTALVEN